MRMVAKYTLLFFALWMASPKLKAKKRNCRPLVHISKHANASFMEEVLFYAHTLGIGDSVALQIRFSLKLPESENGLIKYENTGFGKARHQVTIWINRRLTPSEISMTLAHELVHAAQFIQGHLRRSNHHVFLWHGEVFNSQRMRHADRPWEREAINRGYELRTTYLGRRKRIGISSIHPFPKSL